MNNISSDIDYTSIPTKTALLNSCLTHAVVRWRPTYSRPSPRDHQGNHSDTT